MMHMLLAVALDENTGAIERAWWRPGSGDHAWTGPAAYADVSDIASAIRAGHKVFSWIHFRDGWRLGPSVVEETGDRGRAGIHLDDSPERVDQALNWLAQNWTLREIESD